MTTILAMILSFLDVAPLEPAQVVEAVDSGINVPFTFIAIGVILLIVIIAVVAICLTHKKQ